MQQKGERDYMAISRLEGFKEKNAPRTPVQIDKACAHPLLCCEGGDQLKT